MENNEDGSESEFYIKFKEHKIEYNVLLATPEDKWWDNARDLEEKYLKQNKKPQHNKLDKNECRYCQWIKTQHNNIRLNKDSMTYPDRRSHWENLRIKYINLLMTENEECIDNIKKVMKFIDVNNICPNKRHDGEEGILGNFVNNLKKSYKNKKGLIFETEVKPIFDILFKNYNVYLYFE